MLASFIVLRALLLFLPMIVKHSEDGRHFLGLRNGRFGGYEIVYEGGINQRRLVWRIMTKAIDSDDMARRFHEAIRTNDVLNHHYSGLRDAEIEFEIMPE